MSNKPPQVRTTYQLQGRNGIGIVMRDGRVYELTEDDLQRIDGARECE